MKLFVVVAFLESEFETTFSRRNWPLHLTLLGNFYSDAAESDLETVLETVTSKTTQFSVQGTSREMFGANNDVSVVEVEYSQALRDLHTILVNAFDTHPENKELVYRPHITDQLKVRIEPGEVVLVDSLALVELTSDEAEVKAVFSLR